MRRMRMMMDTWGYRKNVGFSNNWVIFWANYSCREGGNPNWPRRTPLMNHRWRSKLIRVDVVPYNMVQTWPKGSQQVVPSFFLQGKDCPNHEKPSESFWSSRLSCLLFVVVVVVVVVLTEFLGLGGHLLPRLNQLWIGLRRHAVVHGIYTCTYAHKYSKTYCWWKKSCTSWYGKYPILYRVL